MDRPRKLKTDKRSRDTLFAELSLVVRWRYCVWKLRVIVSAGIEVTKFFFAPVLSNNDARISVLIPVVVRKWRTNISPCFSVSSSVLKWHPVCLSAVTCLMSLLGSCGGWGAGRGPEPAGPHVCVWTHLDTRPKPAQYCLRHIQSKASQRICPPPERSVNAAGHLLSCS